MTEVYSTIIVLLGSTSESQRRFKTSTHEYMPGIRIQRSGVGLCQSIFLEVSQFVQAVHLDPRSLLQLTYKIGKDSQTRKQTYGCWRGRDSQGVCEGHVHAAIPKMDNKQGPTVQNRELCSMLCGSLDKRGVWGRMDSSIQMAESLYYSPETITTLLIGYVKSES